MSTLNTEIQEAIRKSLPEQTANELKQYLATAESNAKKVVQLEERVLSLMKYNSTKTDQLIKAGDLEAREQGISCKEKEIMERLAKISHQEEIIKLKLDHAVDIKCTALEMVRTVFKSQPVGYAFSTSRIENANEAIPNNSGYHNMANTSRSSTENVTKREITE